MTDVPGHTIAMVKHFVKYGIKFLHIGVNTATPNPEVYDIFKWKCEEDEVIVMYINEFFQNIEIRHRYRISTKTSKEL